MPAANIMAIHDALENSGCSSAAPRRILPNLEAAMTMTKMTKMVEKSTNAQPRLVSTQVSMLFAVASKLVGLPRPQTTIARTRSMAGITTGQLMD